MNIDWPVCHVKGSKVESTSWLLRIWMNMFVNNFIRMLEIMELFFYGNSGVVDPWDKKSRSP